MTARSRMTMRCDIERDQAIGTDGYNRPVKANYQPHLNAVACWFGRQRREEVIDARREVVVNRLFAMLPLGTDVNETDRITEVRDRVGTVLFGGPFPIDGVNRTPTHLELEVRRAQA